MKKIAVLSSGEAGNAWMLYRFFEGGNRLSFDLLLSDNTLPRPLAQKVTEVTFPVETWTLDPSPIVKILQESNIDMLVVDSFNLPIPAAILSMYPDKILTLTGDDTTANARALVEQLERVHIPTPPPLPSGMAADKAWDDTLNAHPSTQEPSAEVTVETPPEEVTVVINDNAPSTQYGATQHPQNPYTQGYQPNQQNPYQQGYQQGYQPQMQGADGHRPTRPNNYLVWCLICILLCCLIPGVVAMVYSMQVNPKYSMGDYRGAQRASELAQIWIIVSIVTGIVFNALYVPCVLLAGL